MSENAPVVIASLVSGALFGGYIVFALGRSFGWGQGWRAAMSIRDAERTFAKQTKEDKTDERRNAGADNG